MTNDAVLGLLEGGWLWLAGDLILAVLLLVCLLSDLTKGEVYNWATLPAMLLGLLLGWLKLGLAGLGAAALGLAVGGGVFLLPFVIGAMGGGDVKLLAAVGALTGPLFAIKTAFYACIIGGGVAVALMLLNGSLVLVLKDMGSFIKGLAVPGLRPPPPKDRDLPHIPFAVCIALGAAWTRWFDLLPAVFGG